MAWINKRFSELSIDELYDLIRLRLEVFVVEQDAPYLDTDGKDKLANHLFYKNKDDEIIACCRLLPPGISYDEASIGRVVVDSKNRGSGLAREMMLLAVGWLDQHYPDAGIRISGQLYLEKFYQSVGFETVSDIYLEDGISHVSMLRTKIAEISYFGHSCFLLKSRQRMLLFDYGTMPVIDNKIGLIKEHIASGLGSELPLYIFSSHTHADHFDPQTRDIFPQARKWLIGLDARQQFVISGQQSSNQISDAFIRLVRPREVFELDDMKLFCSGSSDQGTSFMIQAPELTVYHGGDLAYWDEEPQYADVHNAEIDWLGEICRKQTGRPDIAFIPASTSDGYQEAPLIKGLDHTLSQLRPRIAIPMHAYGYEHLYQAFADWLNRSNKPEENMSEKQRTQALVMTRPGDTSEVKIT